VNTSDREEVVFDMDGTLLDGDLGETVFYLHMLQKCTAAEDVFASVERGHLVCQNEKAADGLLKYEEYKRIGNFERAYKYSVELLEEQLTYSEVHNLAERVLQISILPYEVECRLRDTVVMLRIGVHLRPHMAALVRRFEQMEIPVWVVSASPQPVVDAAAKAISIVSEHAIGAALSWNVNPGKEQEDRFPWGDDKVKVLRNFGVRPFMAFGDSMGDEPLLKSADYAFVTPNADTKLIEIAERMGWHILSFSEDDAGLIEKYININNRR